MCASLSEDRYGIVQRDIPRILEAFLAFLDAVEDSQVEINAKDPKPSNDVLKTMNSKDLEELARIQHEVAKASEILGHVSGGEFYSRSISFFEELICIFRSFERRGGTNRADFWR